MKILITGGAGFIGSHLSDYLLADRHKVVVMDNLCLGKKENIAHLLKNKSFKFYKVNLNNAKAMKRVFVKEKFDIVFHLAANSDIADSWKNPGIDFNRTFMTTYSVLDLMREFNIKKIVFASSSAIYGEAKELLSEDHGPLMPVSHYGATKLASEAFISSFAENYGMQAWIVRFPNVVGERATHGAIYDFINKLKINPKQLNVLGNGEQCKPYLYVKDLVEAMLYIWKNCKEKINIYNVGVDSCTKVKDIARVVIEEMGLHARVKYTGGDRGWIGDVPEFKYDLSKINALGWKAKITSDEAVRKAIIYILGRV